MGRVKKKKMPQLELEIESIGFEGVSVARHEEKVYFVDEGIPGDKVLAQVYKKRKRHAHARILELLEASPVRQEPRCQHFWECGGCRWQHMPYSEQLKWKERNTIDAMERLGHLKGLNYESIIPSPKEYHYRNKMEFSFSAMRWLSDAEVASGEDIEDKDFALGLHAAGNFAKAIDVKFCHIQPFIGNPILEAIRKRALDLGLSAHNAFENTGFLRNLVIRTGTEEKEVMVILITREAKTEEEKEFAENFWKLLPDGYHYEAVHAVNSTPNPRQIDHYTVLNGKGYIKSEILGVEFRVSPFTFFQTNTSQLDSFLGKAIDEAGISESDTVWDLYCGTGSLTLPSARKAKKVIGIELVEESIEFAKENAKLNEIENTDFYACDLHTKELPALFGELESPDIIITDPPRAGMHQNMVEHILAVAPRRIVYVSCNPATQARDLALMTGDYEITKVTPVDLFPHTYHIESIAVLERRNNNDPASY